MYLSQLKRKTKQKHHRQVGRGGTRGKTSGRGTKGQNARAGHRKRPELRDIIKKIPKLRGHGKNRAVSVIPRTSFAVVNLATLETSNLTAVNPETLVAAKLVPKVALRKGVKVLGTGEITKAIQVSKCTVSESARAKILAASGTIA